MGDKSVTYNPVLDYDSPVISPPTEWDVLVVNGTATPGIVEIDCFNRESGIDDKRTKGVKGATLTINAAPPAAGKFIFQLWGQSHFIAWDTLRQLFIYDPLKKTANPVTVEHPSLADLQITSVVAKYISPVKHVGLNLYIITVDAYEYRPNTGGNLTATPNSPPQGVQGGLTAAAKPPSPTDPLQLKIAGLLKQLQGP